MFIFPAVTATLLRDVIHLIRVPGTARVCLSPRLPQPYFTAECQDTKAFFLAYILYIKYRSHIDLLYLLTSRHARLAFRVAR